MERTKWKICDQAEGVHVCVHAESCHILCHPMDCSPQGTIVHGVFQARILEWVPFSPPGIESELIESPTQGLNLNLLCLLDWQANSLPLCHQGSLGYTVH